MMQRGLTPQCGPYVDWEGWTACSRVGDGSFGDNTVATVSRSHSDGHAHQTRVLVVDDEQLIADTLARILNLSGFAAHAVYNGEDAIASIASHCPHIVLTDVRMPGRNGIETGILIRKQCPDIRVVLFSGQAGVVELMEQARRDGHGFQLWSKPLHPRELVERLRAL